MAELTTAAVQDQLPDWTIVDHRLEISILAKDFVHAIDFVNRFAEVAETQNHHPDFDIRYNTVRMRVLSHDVGHLTERDLNFAKAINELIEELELKRQPNKITRTQLVILTPNIAVIKPFWQAIYDFRESTRDPSLLTDRSDVLPPIRFQELPDVQRSTEASDSAPGNMHLEVMVPAALAAQRLQSAIDAGGKLLSDAKATYRWELADADGNRVILRADH